MPKSYGQLVPSLARRLSAWVSISEQRAAAEAPPTRPTITLSRSFGCEAYPVSEHLRDLLEARTRESWNIYDRALLEQVAEDEHLSLKLLQNLGGPSRAGDTIGFLFQDHHQHYAVFRQVGRHILHLAETGNAIIVGRGGAIFTQKLPNCYHFRLDAPFEFRVASMARRLDLPESEAERMVRQHDKAREKLIEDCLHADVADIAYYHVVFNNARFSPEEIARAIVDHVSSRWKDKTYFRAPGAP